MSSVPTIVSELNLILLGPPGAGKGTQAERLLGDFSVAHLSTGNLLREARSDPNNELGREAAEYMDKGQLVPDELVIALIERKIAEESGDGFLLDGFPRNLAQAQKLDEILERVERRLTAALLIEVPDDEVIRRISGRRQCSQGHIYNVHYDRPKHEGVCDRCGKPLFQREDDKEEVISERLAVYHRETKPLIEYYESRGLLRRFDGRRAPTEVHDHIRATLATLRLEERL